MEFNRKEKLRIGLLINRSIVDDWFFLMISKINNSDYAEIVLVVEKETPDIGGKSLFKKIKENYHLLAHITYRKLENLIFVPQPFAFAKKNLQKLIPQVPVLKVNVIKKKYSDIIQLADIEKILPYHIDVFIQNGFRII